MSAVTLGLPEITPRCPHFGPCGGCQYQALAYAQQLELKRNLLAQTLADTGLTGLPEIQVHAAEPYEYRNRIRLRLERVEGHLRWGYNETGSRNFLPIATCPIAAPILWATAQALLAITGDFWLDAADEAEFFTDGEQQRVQITLLCRRKVDARLATLPRNSFAKTMDALHQACPWVTGAGAMAVDRQTGRVLREIVGWGAAGLAYRVNDETYWISRGAFFQVNRFLLPELVNLVTAGRQGSIAWDLFAGVGLFSRVLARHFTQVTAVEVGQPAATDLRNALHKLGPQHHAEAKTTLDFLQKALVDRERPELIVLDPPRAGAGVEACALLARLQPRQMVYVSCDPSTLARDLAVLTARGYNLAALHLVDLFPQTTHLETVVVLQREA